MVFGLFNNCVCFVGDEMKITEEKIFYSFLINGQWSIQSPIWKFEKTAIEYVNKRADEYSWKKNPISNNEFKESIYSVIKIDLEKLPVVYETKTKDLRKNAKRNKVI